MDGDAQHPPRLDAPQRLVRAGAAGARYLISFIDLKPDSASFLEDVIAGLSRRRKALSPKYFYDERGSALFEAICELPEYYPTRTEMAMLQMHAGEMARCLGPDCLLIEYGSGSGRKTRVLLGALKPAAYIPIDIAAGQLQSWADSVAQQFPELRIVAVCADYSREFTLPHSVDFRGHRRVVYFPGSTIGNLTVTEARSFLRRARALTGTGGAMLVGVDLKKDHARLHAAYNDAQGVTAAFNLNLLARINRELDGDFDLTSFRHHAFYNARLGRIEMHLVSLREQKVSVAGRGFAFRAGERLHTENSYKYSVAEFQALARAVGFAPERSWTDADQLFAVHYLVAA
jgi:dimethylhistidine N-methyltransferase